MYTKSNDKANDPQGMVDFDLVAKLVRKVKKGNIKAFSELYRLYFRQVHYAAYRYLGNKDDAAEVTQEVFGQVYKKLGDMRSPAAFHRWINRIVFNLSLNLLKKRESEQKHMGTREFDAYEDLLSEESREFLPESYLESKEDQASVLNAVDDLTIAQKAAVVMYYFEDMSVPEIAKATDTSEQAIYKRLFDAKAVLKKELNLQAKTAKLSVSAAAVPVLTEIFNRDASLISNPQVSDSIYSTLITGLGIAGGIGGGGLLKAITDSVIGKVIAGTVGVALIGGGAVVVSNLVSDGASRQPNDVTTIAQPLELPGSGELPAPVIPEKPQESVVTTPTAEPVQPKTPVTPAPQQPVTPQEPAPEVAAPVITIANNQLTYVAGTTVTREQIISDASISARDSNGKKIPFSVSRYEQIQFNTPGRYVMYVTATDADGNQAETAIISVRITAQ